MTVSTERSVTDMLPVHAESVAELEKITFSEPWSKKALLDSLDKGIFLVCLENDRVQGYVGSYCIIDEAAITNVAVFPEFKRQGVGEALMRELIRKAGEKGLSMISLEVRASNTAAISLYEKLGFENVGTRRGFYSCPREDAYVLIHKLQRTKS